MRLPTVPTTRPVLLLLAVCSAVALMPPRPAAAGTYVVSQCRLPNATPIEAPDIVGSFSSPFSYWSTSQCPTEGLMGVSLDGAAVHPPASGSTLTFNAPLHTEIVKVEGNRTSGVGVGAAFRQGVAGMTADQTVIEHCANATGCSVRGSGVGVVSTNRFDTGSLSSSTFQFFVACFGGQACPPEKPKAFMNVYRAQFTLSDSLDPTASGLNGPLVAPGTKTGTMAASFTASDQGGGVYRTLMKVDGSVVDADVIDDNGGACRDLVPGGNPYDGFARAVPCELTSSASPTLDTSVVPDGWHKLSLEIEDAAGNRNVIFPPTSFRFDNRSSSNPAGGGGPRGPNGTNATASARIIFEGRSAARRSVKYGRSINIIGRLLTPAGSAIEGAALDVLQRLRLAGAASRPVATIRTDSRGYFKYAVPVGPSRVFDVGYRAVLAPSAVDRSTIEYDARQRVELSVAAGARLRVAPRVARNLDTLRFSGRLLGRPFARRGKVVLLQAQVTRLRRVTWQTFLTARADKKGVFKGRYRLTRSVGAKGYRFRAVVPRGDDYPYGTGASRPAKVKIVR